MDRTACRRASTSRPRPWRSEPANRLCPADAPADPRAGSGPSKCSAAHRHRRCSGQLPQRGASATHTRPEVKEGLPKVHPRTRGIMASTSRCGPPRYRPTGHRARHHPTGVGVDHTHVGLEGEGQDRPWRYRHRRPAARGARRGRRAPGSMVPDDDPGRPVEVAGPSVVAEAPPRPQHVPEGAPAHVDRVGKAGEEPLVGGSHPRQLGLLGHHFTDQHRPRIAVDRRRQSGRLEPRRSPSPRRRSVSPMPTTWRGPGYRRGPGVGAAGPLNSRRRPRTDAGAAVPRPASTPSPCAGRSRPPSPALVEALGLHGDHAPVVTATRDSTLSTTLVSA